MSKTPTVSLSPSPSFFIRMGNFFFHYRGGLFPVTFLVFALAVPPVHFGGNLRLDLVAIVIGTVVALMGQVIRCATIGLVYIKRGGKNRRIYASKLVTEGIYAHTRNPMYLGNIMIAGGICLIYGSPWVYAVAFSFFLLVYLSITKAEEHYLRGQFGDEFDAYCRTTNRFWPRMKGLGQTIAQHHFEWKYVVNKEQGTLLGFSLGLYVVMLLKYYRVYASSPIPERPLLLAIPLVPMIMLYGLARWLKKSGRA
jgi:protein-S-isoprenylcysteine O-methyltransferase Ste14